MGARWNGKISKLKAWSAKGESSTTSFIAPKSNESVESSEFTEGRSENPSIDDVSTGQTREFTPNQEYNFKSAYKRYTKALDLTPSKIKTEGNKTTYYYYSDNSNTGFWEVTIEDDSATFINLLIRSYNIVCPPAGGFKLTGTIESDGTKFKWEQKSGNRTVLFDDNSIAEPTIFIESSCYTGNCTNESSSPIILRVSLENNSSVFQDLIIYNTLTSTYFGNSVSTGVTLPSDITCQKVTPTPYITLPSYAQKAYCENVETSFFVSWDPPSCDSQFVTRYSLVANTTGNYVEVDSVTVDEEKIFEMELGKYYKIVTHFNIYGKISSTPSDILYYLANDAPHLAYGDDSYNGIGASGLSSNYSKIDLKVNVLEQIENYQGLSSSKLSSSYSKVDLKVGSYEYVDTYSGIGGSKLTNSYAKVNLGGVIIG